LLGGAVSGRLRRHRENKKPHEVLLVTGNWVALMPRRDALERGARPVRITCSPRAASSSVFIVMR
jgi:hypothetical protein